MKSSDQLASFVYDALNAGRSRDEYPQHLSRPDGARPKSATHWAIGRKVSFLRPCHAPGRLFQRVRHFFMD